MFFGKIGAFSEDEDMTALEDKINKFEKKLKEQGMQIDNITMSSNGISPDVYCIIHYDSK